MRGSFRVHSVVELCALIAIALLAFSRDRERATPKAESRSQPLRSLIVTTGQQRPVQDRWALN